MLFKGSASRSAEVGGPSAFRHFSVCTEASLLYFYHFSEFLWFLSPKINNSSKCLGAQILHFLVIRSKYLNLLRPIHFPSFLSQAFRCNGKRPTDQGLYRRYCSPPHSPLFRTLTRHLNQPPPISPAPTMALSTQTATPSPRSTPNPPRSSSSMATK